MSKEESNNIVDKKTIQLLQSLPFRIIVDIITFSRVFNNIQINFDEEGKIFRYDPNSEWRYDTIIERKYLSISNLIKLLYGWFKKDRFRKPFLFHTSLCFAGERYVRASTIKVMKKTKLGESVILPIPRKIRSLKFTNLQFSEENIPVIEEGKMEFLEFISCHLSQIDKLGKTFKKFSSSRLKDVYFKEMKLSNQKFDQSSFLPLLLNLSILSFREYVFTDGDLIEKIVSFKEKTKLKVLSFCFKGSLLDPFIKNFCLNVKHLDIFGSRISEKGYEYISKNPHLEDLYCFNCEINSYGLVNLFKSKNIELLNIGYNTASFNNFENMKKVKNKSLECLKIWKNWRDAPTKEFFDYIAENLTCLTSLHLFAAGIESFHMYHICKIRTLKVLVLDYNQGVVTPESLQHLLNLKNLQHLNLSQCDLINEDIKFMCKLKKLVTLNISYNDITDSCLDYLVGCKIKQINVQCTSLTYKIGFEKLKEMESIEKIIYGKKHLESKYWARADPNEKEFPRF